MPRRARLTLPNLSLHVIQRGNNRQACFFAGEDYQWYLLFCDSHQSLGAEIQLYPLDKPRNGVVVSP